MTVLRSTHAPIAVARSVADARRRVGSSARWVYAGCLFATLIFGALAVSTAPRPLPLALLILLGVVGTCVVRPTIGLYATVALAAFGDPATAGWYPFTKNLSSHESMLFISDAAVVSPLEICIAALTLGLALQFMSRPDARFHRGALFYPLLAFSGFVLFGLANGLSHGGDRTVALYEARGMLYLAVLYILAVNLFRRREDYLRLYLLIVFAVVLNTIPALIKLSSITSLADAGLESLVAHGVALPMNFFFVLIAASWFFSCRSQFRRFVLPIAAIPVVIVYLVSQRRAAFIGLLAAIALLMIVLFWTRRRMFWRVAPAVLIIGVLYTAAFWNSQGTLGFPAQAVKTVVAPDQLDQRDQSSDAYREAEKADILFTINSNRYLGIGFGQKFYRPIPLPQITSFLLAEYTPHNSVLWVWMKVGMGGFVAMLFLFGMAMRVGARTLLNATSADDAAVIFTSVCFVVMYAVFAYVDIAWDSQNCVLLAISFACIGGWSTLSESASGPTIASTSSTSSAASASSTAELVAVQGGAAPWPSR